ncbi:MAG: U32 family peptidase [Patescibacteria group bacterium]|nr:U32 family peptidase [Patescibacteria group bacterium]
MRTMLRQRVPEGGLPILEVYGVLSGGALGHGRVDGCVPSVSRSDALAFRRMLRDEGVAFTYLLNAPHSPAKDLQSAAADEYLSWVLAELRPDALTIASHELMAVVRSKDASIPIHISTVAGIKTAQELENFLDVKPRRVVPHHNLGKNWDALADVVESASKNSIEVELLVTESCLYDCSMREAHYSFVADPKHTTDVKFHLWCQSKKVGDPGEFLRAGGAIRPEDTHLLQARGVTVFKISGRSRPAADLPDVVAAYRRRRFDGNLFQLLGITPAIQKGWAYLHNPSLNDFLERMPQGSVEAQKEYCDAVAARLYAEGNFYVKGATYTTQNGKLTLQPGTSKKAAVSSNLA